MAVSETEEFEFRARAEREAATGHGKPPAPENPTSAGNLLGAAIEPALAMSSAGILQPLSGLAGLGAMGTNALGITDTPPADIVNEVQGMAYEPRTTGGKNAMTAFGAIPQALGKGAEWAGGKTLGFTGSPLAATGVETALKGVPQILGMKGGAKLGETPGVLKPKPPSPAVQMLARRGVTMTPGDIKGGIMNDIEQKMTSLPIIGTAIKNARGKTVEQFQQAQINEGLSEVGQKLPKNLIGHEAIDHAAQVFDDKYSTLLPKLSGDLDLDPRALAAPGAKPVKSLRSELESLKSMANAGLPPEQAGAVSRIIDQDIIAKFTKYGKANGASLQEIRENLRNEIEARQRSNVPDDRKVALAMQAAREAMDDMIERVNPKYSTEYAKLRKGYALFEVARVASARVGAREGVATPNQYMSAVREQDKSKGKRAFSRGKALGQPLARAGRKVLSNDVADSGTAGRLTMLDLLTGTGAAGAGVMGHPGVLLGAALVPALYSQWGLRAIQPLLLGKTKTAPGAAALASGGAFAQQPSQERAAGVVP
jgi:hypothetical protein